MRSAVQLPNPVYDALTQIYRDGTDMKDIRAVIKAADRRGDKVTVQWLHNNVKVYTQALVYGFESAGTHH